MIRHIPFENLPRQLQVMPSPPAELFTDTATATTLDSIMRHKRVAIVGTRRVTDYGKLVTQKFATELAAQGVVIVSGLAFGVDSIAHRAALDAGGLSLAVLPGPLDYIVPRSHQKLAADLVARQGALISEYPAGTPIFKHQFVARNRLVTGISDALVIIEATEDSGTLYTANFAAKQNIRTLVVPGNITSQASIGTNRLIKHGATPITATADILQAIGLSGHTPTDPRQRRIVGDSPQEQHIIELLEQGITQGSQLLNHTGLDVQQFTHHLTMLEINAKIKSLGNNNWGLA